MTMPLREILFSSRRGVSGTCISRLGPQKVPAKVSALLDCAISPMAIYSTLARWAPSTSLYKSLLTSSDSSPLTDSSLAPLLHALSIRRSSNANTCVVDTGASMCFCRTTHPCVQPWSICPLDRPLRIQQGTTACYCRQFGIALLIFEHAINADDGMVLTIPVFLVETFHEGLFLLSPSVLRVVRIQLTDPVDADPFLFVVPQTTFAVPQNVDHLPHNLMTVRLTRQNNLLTGRLRASTDFENLFSMLTCLPFNWDETLAAITQSFPPLKGKSILKRPASVSNTLPTKSGNTTVSPALILQYQLPNTLDGTTDSAALASVPTVRIRTGIICAGVTSERVFAQEAWFRRAFDVCLICESDSSRLNMARTTFPNARLHQDVRTLPAALSQTPLTLDLLVVSFPCVDETLLKALNGYQDTSTADLFRGPLRYQLLELTKARLLVEENTPPHSHSSGHHSMVHQTAMSRGLHSVPTILDSASIGCATSRQRWIHWLSPQPLPRHLDAAVLSTMSSVSTSVASVLQPAPSVPRELWITDANVTKGVIPRTFNRACWHATRSPRLAICHNALRSFPLATDALLAPHLHEQITLLACYQQPVTVLGIHAQPPQLSPALTRSQFGLRNVRLWYLLHRLFAAMSMCTRIRSLSLPTLIPLDQHLFNMCYHSIVLHWYALAFTPVQRGCLPKRFIHWEPQFDCHPKKCLATKACHCSSLLLKEC